MAIERRSDTAPSTFAQREAEAKRLRIAGYDRLAPERGRWLARSSAYHRGLERLIRFVIPEGASVLEIGCGTGELLAALKPADGLGIDLSPRMVEEARRKNPGLRFAVADAEDLDAPELAGRTFDYVVLSDLVGAVSDVWSVFRALRRVCSPRTRVVVTYYNFLWEPALRLAERLGLKMPIEQQNWLGRQDIENLLALNHFEIVRSGTAQLLPVGVPLLARAVNRYLASAPGFRHLALTQYFVCRLASGGQPVPVRDYSCSVIVPCKNERGNIDDIVARTPEMGTGTEIIFVDGNSNDGTVEAIQSHIDGGSRPRLRLLHQGSGKGRQAEPQDRRAAGAVPRSHLWRDQDQPLQKRRATRCHDRLCLPEVQEGKQRAGQFAH